MIKRRNDQSVTRVGHPDGMFRERPLILSHFTPSLMSAEVLEDMFVQRGRLASTLAALVRKSALSRSKHHSLVVGARGTGKTHLLSLVTNRVSAMPDLEDKLRIAWLREEEWGVSSMVDLLYRVLRRLSDTYGDAALAAEAESLFGMSIGTAERRAGIILDRFLEGRTLLIVAENLDDLFEGLGIAGQRKLRAFIQERGTWSILASAQALFGGVSLRESPFYGFFDIHRLKELSIDDAVHLVARIAMLRGDPGLAEFVNTPTGRARVRAIHHLAGGNHRIYVMLSEFLTRESLDALVEPFLRAMDDLTPYYQARMASLSPQQRKIVDLLCESRGALAVKAIAKRSFMTSQTASSQLKQLREKGYVRSTSVGRDSYYEIAEPLMRIALDVKRQRSAPLRLFIDFLRHWYKKDELANQLRALPKQWEVERRYIELAVGGEATDGDEFQSLSEAYDESLKRKDFESALDAARGMLALRATPDAWIRLGGCSLNLGDYEAAYSAYAKATSMDRSETVAVMGQCIAAQALGKHEFVVERTIEPEADERFRDLARLLRAESLNDLGQHQLALELFDELLASDPSNLEAMRGRRSALLLSNQLAESLEQSARIVEHAPENVRDLGYYATLLMSTGEYARAETAFRTLLELAPDHALGAASLGRVLWYLDREADAVQYMERALAVMPAVFDTSPTPYSLTLLTLGRTEDALTFLRGVLSRAPHNIEALELFADLLLMQGRVDEAHEVIGTVAESELTSSGRFVVARIFTKSGSREESLSHLVVALDRSDPSAAFAAAEALTEFVEAFNGTEDLANALVRGSGLATSGRYTVLALAHVPALTMMKVDAATNWAASFAGAAEDIPALEVATRLGLAYSAFRSGGDVRNLLALPIEEREVILEVMRKAKVPIPPELQADDRPAV